LAQLKLITVDLDDTLWPCRPPLEVAERETHRWLLRNAPRLGDAHTVESLRDHRLRTRDENPAIAHDLTAVRRVSLRRLLDDFGYDRNLAEVAMAVFLDHRNRVSPYDDSSPVLRELARDYPLVSLTNGNADVERTPLSGHFQKSYRAEDVGAAKPDPALFVAALDWAGVKPESALHLGDDPLLDVEGARRFGLRAVWVNRNGAEWPADLPAPELTVSDLHHLKPWISQNFDP